jgi:hypothetical protein
VFIVISPFTGIFDGAKQSSVVDAAHPPGITRATALFGKAAGAFRLGLAGVRSLWTWTVRHSLLRVTMLIVCVRASGHIHIAAFTLRFSGESLSMPVSFSASALQ